MSAQLKGRYIARDTNNKRIHDRTKYDIVHCDTIHLFCVICKTK